ncbi:MAG: phosphoribosylglycinamide formyltransferase [Actinobacteria bacterium]|nr:phosphoribosylglycinamide formyltransferase [Actinomycetota bacterium]
MLSVVVLISGSGSNLLALLKASENPLYPAKIVAVGSDKDAAGLAHAELFEVDTFVVEPERFANRDQWAKTLLANVLHHQPDLVVLAGFMKILPASFVTALRGKLINTHPSLLPQFPGAHAVRDALTAGVTKTGVTIHKVDEGVDTGEIIIQQEIYVEPGDTEQTLHERIKVVERELLVSTVEDIASRRIVLV